MKTLPAPLLAKISWRLLPFLLLMYIMAFLDRANVGFAKQAFQADTNISDCLLYTSPSPRDGLLSRMPSSA